MPYDRATPFGTHHGLMSQEEVAGNDAASREAARQAQMAAIQAQMAMSHEANATQRYGIDTGLKQSGTFGERSASDMAMEGLRGTNQANVARINIGPNQTYADIANRQDLEGKPMRDLKTQFAQQLFSGMGINGAGAPAGGPGMGAGAGAGAGAMPAGGGGAPSSLEDRLMAFSVLNGGQAPDIAQRDMNRQIQQLQLEELKRGQTKTRQAEQLQVDPTGAQAASKASGVPLDIPRLEQLMMEHPEMGQQLGQMTNKFVAKDTSVVGWDPTEKDQQDIQVERDRLVQILVGKGYPIDQATREANRVVTQNLGDNQNDVNAGWTQGLRGKLGL